MIYETLDDGTLLTDEAVDKLVTDVHAALERGDYHVIPNSHNTTAPINLPEQHRAELFTQTGGDFR
jgi:hypothetical protein